MKAAICSAYGPPDVIKIMEVPKPEPKDNEVLIKIMSASLNSGDVRIRGLNAPFLLRPVMRLMFGIFKPRKPVLGIMFSGIIEAVGSQVKTFKPGDEVFGSTGMKMGAHAQYIALKENGTYVIKPQNASFEAAAAILFGGMTAVYFLEKGGIRSITKPKVLIYGATGSVGTAAVEIAKSFNAMVTSVCSNNGAELAKSLGSDHIVIYTEEDYRQLDEKFDMVFDAVGKTKKNDASHLLKEGGKYLTVGGLDVAKETVGQIEFLSNLYTAGKLRANIDKTYSLDEIVEAHTYVDTGRKKGNVVLKINE